MSDIKKIKLNGVIYNITAEPDTANLITKSGLAQSTGNATNNAMSQDATTTAISAKYTKPSGGIPSTDMTNEVQTSLSKADSALQSHQDISGKQDVLIAGSNISIAADGKTISATNTTYSNATTEAAGLMSTEDKTKLNGIASGATANVGTITSVKMNGSTISSSGEADLGTVITSHQDISGKLNTSQVKNSTSTTAGDVYDVRYINSVLGDVNTALEAIINGGGE